MSAYTELLSPAELRAKEMLEFAASRPELTISQVVQFLQYVPPETWAQESEEEE